MSELYIGLMSGTSMDGIDAALVDFSEQPPQLIDSFYTPFDKHLVQKIQELGNPESPFFLPQYGELDTQLGQLYSNAVLSLLKKSSTPASEVLGIGSHGQTLYHAPYADPAFCLQIGDANIIAQKTGITTVADFRRRDIAAGGQGAPLAPGLHHLFFSDPDENRVILNLGGIANITRLPKDQNTLVTGFDTGPGNGLMDYWINKNLAASYDENGDWASSGSTQKDLLDALLEDPYFNIDPPKSTGKEYFSAAWLENILAKQKPHSAEDIQASLCEFTSQSICKAINKYADNPDRVLVCGGGVHNATLMTLIREKLPCPVVSTEVYGLDPDQVEAVAFAWLAKQTMSGLPGNLTSVTGAKHSVILGAIYPA